MSGQLKCLDPLLEPFEQLLNLARGQLIEVEIFIERRHLLPVEFVRVAGFEQLGYQQPPTLLITSEETGLCQPLPRLSRARRTVRFCLVMPQNFRSLHLQ